MWSAANCNKKLILCSAVPQLGYKQHVIYVSSLYKTKIKKINLHWDFSSNIWMLSWLEEAHFLTTLRLENCMEPSS